jgi:hypothetical protein
MSAEIPALPFKMRHSAAPVTPRYLVVSVTDLVPKTLVELFPDLADLALRRAASCKINFPAGRSLP